MHLYSYNHRSGQWADERIYTHTSVIMPNFHHQRLTTNCNVGNDLDHLFWPLYIQYLFDYHHNQSLTCQVNQTDQVSTTLLLTTGGKKKKITCCRKCLFEQQELLTTFINIMCWCLNLNRKITMKTDELSNQDVSITNTSNFQRHRIRCM